MDSNELRELRAGTGLTQTEFAPLVGLTPNQLGAREQGKVEVSAALARRVQRLCDRIGGPYPPDGEGPCMDAELALGEAVLLMDGGQPDELYGRVARSLVNRAAARAAMGRVEGSLLDSLEKARRDLDEANLKISTLRFALGDGAAS